MECAFINERLRLSEDLSYLKLETSSELRAMLEVRTEALRILENLERILESSSK